MTFNELNLNTSLRNALSDLGYNTPSTIQHKVFPVVMSGCDVIGIAQTGTGKTLAYLLPALRQWKFTQKKQPQILIVVPTRELVVQVVREVEKLIPYMSVVVTGVYGGVNIKTQLEIIHKGIDVIVGTPGRLLDLTLTGVLKLKEVKKFVIDEVDEMLSLGFRPQLTRLMDLLPTKRQNLMFSATLTPDVENIIDIFFTKPIRIEATPIGTPLEQITQQAYTVPNINTKLNLASLILKNKDEFVKVLIFTATKKQADRLFENFEPLFGQEVGVIHSNKAQNNRFNTVKNFQNGNIRLLIATDIIARGIDISEVTHVLNFDIPEVPETYIHRIGRTGRVDKRGIAISIFTTQQNEERQKIENLMNTKIPELPLPAELVFSDILTEEEMPVVVMPNVPVKNPVIKAENSAFHDKKDKNKKINIKLTRAMRMKLKYKKAKTRGQKPRGKNK